MAKKGNIWKRDHRFVGKVNGHPKLWEIKAQEDLEKEHEINRWLCFGVVANLKIDIPVNILLYSIDIFPWTIGWIGSFCNTFSKNSKDLVVQPMENFPFKNGCFFNTYSLFFSENNKKHCLGCLCINQFLAFRSLFVVPIYWMSSKGLLIVSVKLLFIVCLLYFILN